VDDADPFTRERVAETEIVEFEPLWGATGPLTAD
jgi:hypothetical protein